MNQASRPSAYISRLLDGINNISNLVFAFAQWKDCSEATIADVDKVSSIIIGMAKQTAQPMANQGYSAGGSQRLRALPLTITQGRAAARRSPKASCMEPLRQEI